MKMKLEEAKELAKIARELRAAGVLLLKMPGLELSLAPDTGQESPSRQDGESQKVAPTAVRAALDFLQSGGRHGQG